MCTKFFCYKVCITLSQQHLIALSLIALSCERAHVTLKVYVQHVKLNYIDDSGVYWAHRL